MVGISPRIKNRKCGNNGLTKSPSAILMADWGGKGGVERRPWVPIYIVRIIPKVGLKRLLQLKFESHKWFMLNKRI